jgi:putative salt-induced outer membrane protein YdiY
MNYPNVRYRSVFAAFAALLCVAAARLGADTLEIKNGTRIIGKIGKIDAGMIEVDTTFAGTVKVKQSEVTSITTDAPIAVRLASGTRFDGQVSAGPSGAIQIAGSDGTITTTVEKISASWTAGKVDPAVDRHWAYEAAVDVTGKSGNKSQLGTAASVRATLKTAQDTLQLYTAYDRQVTDQVKAADQFKAGIDYQNNFKGQLSWYARDEGGFDRVKDIQLYNVAAFGLGFDVIKEPKHTLTARVGLSYRYEGYRNPATADVNSAGLDFGLSHEMTFDNAKLVNRLSYVPSFEDFSNYRATHESFFEVPLAAPAWKLRLGLSNDYNSKPGPGVKKLDTTYFTRLVLNWQ